MALPGLPRLPRLPWASPPAPWGGGSCVRLPVRHLAPPARTPVHSSRASTACSSRRVSSSSSPAAPSSPPPPPSTASSRAHAPAAELGPVHGGLAPSDLRRTWPRAACHAFGGAWQRSTFHVKHATCYGSLLRGRSAGGTPPPALPPRSRLPPGFHHTARVPRSARGTQGLLDNPRPRKMLSAGAASGALPPPPRAATSKKKRASVFVAARDAWSPDDA